MGEECGVRVPPPTPPPHPAWMVASLLLSVASPHPRLAAEAKL